CRLLNESLQTILAASGRMLETRLSSVIPTAAERLSGKSSRLKVGIRVAHKVHRLWERWKYPACGLVDNASSLRSSVFQACLTPRNIGFDNCVKNQQELAHSRN